MISWSTVESTPAGKSFGSGMGLALRQLRSAVAERMSVEHYWDTGATPYMYHVPGVCPVVKMSDGVPSSTYVIGALQFDYVNKRLYRDNGASMLAFGGLDHGLMTSGSLTDVNAHLQYFVPSDPDQDFDNVTVKKVTGLSETDVDYTFDVRTRRAIMPRILHPLTGDAPHDDGSADPTWHAGTDKLKTRDVVVYDGNLSGVVSNIDCGGLAIDFWLDPASDNQHLIIFGQCGTTTPSGWNTVVTIEAGSSVYVKLMAKVIDI